MKKMRYQAIELFLVTRSQLRVSGSIIQSTIPVELDYAPTCRRVQTLSEQVSETRIRFEVGCKSRQKQAFNRSSCNNAKLFRILFAFWLVLARTE